ncbi:eukaryotic translation initiation factor 3 subunit I-like [Malania oleifera]|uniref:eukaryotic translation initiation factor 3 subunit I-like n=1 Tax=Malania oleifera TaxID=397392 RepID=UPI0025AE18D0|nr:eukaryotic translation initiation factor 3 subunit I-like [Malania oleifera]XP_057981657.1 eukaryotic translation initiation factor 3 subunit I-like [Malania oleifera]XP_057981658.1 eukaryotic translation initiation factor 3 subunit I-like [Malania oleifera]XP_057981659.1 eukaryotic translation initiation factor 3 subunit I-like [Malania oleifera]XP_057981660.1 eukaryotic translation initiation factor 3 subunit I-like [Malania oleifera]
MHIKISNMSVFKHEVEEGLEQETGKLLKEADKETGHKKTITSLSKSADGSHFLTGSLDKSAKLWDIRSLTFIKTYVTERLVNAVAMSPLDHVCVGQFVCISL